MEKDAQPCVLKSFHGVFGFAGGVMELRPWRISYTITQTANIISHGNGDYTATSDDPSLTIQLKKDDIDHSKGPFHVRMSFVVHSRLDRVISEIYLPTEHGYSQASAITRHYASGDTQEYIIHCNYIHGPLRLDPQNARGDFRLSRLCFYGWSAAAARITILLDYKRRKMDPTRRQANNFSDEVPKALFNDSFDIVYAYYTSCAPELVHHPYSLWSKFVEKSYLNQLYAQARPEESIKFSILTPVYNTDPTYLRECAESILGQDYGNWEHCIVDDCSTNQATIDALKQLERLDPRIKVHYRSSNDHICNATNDALAVATGDRICFLDHDDILPQQALFKLASVIQSNPKLKLIYSDEDFLDEEGNRISPHFKSDWNLHLLYSHNYITHLVCIDAALARQVGGMRLGTEGAQDYDFLLRVSRHLQPDEIFHIPEILYHWRISETSTARSSSAKPYTVGTGKKALEHHFLQLGEEVNVKPLAIDNFYHIEWKFTDKTQPLISIVIPTRNGLHFLKTCIDSIFERSTYRSYEIIIVDNGSDDPATLAYFTSLTGVKNSKVRVYRLDEPFNYSRLNNYAIQFCKGELICLLNNDTEVISSDWLEQLASHAIRPEIGCVGAKLLFSDGSIQHAGVIMSLGGYACHSHRGLPNESPGYFYRPHINQEVSAVTAACLMVKKSVYEQVNGLDEVLFTVAYNDVDFCLKVRQLGLKNLYVAGAVLYHYESKTRGEEDSPEKVARFEEEKKRLKQKWSSLLEEDPFYNPNLTKDREDFSLRVC